MRNTLGLDDDLDPNELQDALEVSFGMRFSASEASACRTVDDIFQIIRARLSLPREGVEGCATAMAFYRLRRALSDLNVGTQSPLTPGTRLENLPELSARGLLAGLSQRSELRLPRRKPALLGQVGVWLMFGGIAWLLLSAIVAPPLWPTGIAASVLGAGLFRIDPGRLPADCQTLGGLARKVAGLNFGDLYTQGAKARDQDIWNALLEILSDYTFLPKAEINPGTLILQKQLHAGRSSHNVLA